MSNTRTNILCAFYNYKANPKAFDHLICIIGPFCTGVFTSCL